MTTSGLAGHGSEIFNVLTFHEAPTHPCLRLKWLLLSAIKCYLCNDICCFTKITALRDAWASKKIFHQPWAYILSPLKKMKRTSMRYSFAWVVVKMYNSLPQEAIWHEQLGYWNSKWEKMERKAELRQKELRRHSWCTYRLCLLYIDCRPWWILGKPTKQKQTFPVVLIWGKTNSDDLLLCLSNHNSIYFLIPSPPVPASEKKNVLQNVFDQC